MGSRGVKLVSPDGQHSQWADPKLRPILNGYGMGVVCRFGGRPMVHWLALDPQHARRYVFQNAEYAFPSASEAVLALEAYRTQTE
jgi:hypothetical protein